MIHETDNNSLLYEILHSRRQFESFSRFSQNRVASLILSSARFQRHVNDPPSLPRPFSTLSWFFRALFYAWTRIPSKNKRSSHVTLISAIGQSVRNVENRRSTFTKRFSSVGPAGSWKGNKMTFRIWSGNRRF